MKLIKTVIHSGYTAYKYERKSKVDCKHVRTAF